MFSDMNINSVNHQFPDTLLQDLVSDYLLELGNSQTVQNQYEVMLAYLMASENFDFEVNDLSKDYGE